MADIVSAHSDPRIWKNPSEFDPSRFLRPNGEGLCLKTKRQCLPFGAGMSGGLIYCIRSLYVLHIIQLISLSVYEILGFKFICNVIL